MRQIIRSSQRNWIIIFRPVYQCIGWFFSRFLRNLIKANLDFPFGDIPFVYPDFFYCSRCCFGDIFVRYGYVIAVILPFCFCIRNRIFPVIPAVLSWKLSSLLNLEGAVHFADGIFHLYLFPFIADIDRKPRKNAFPRFIFSGYSAF